MTWWRLPWTCPWSVFVCLLWGAMCVHYAVCSKPLEDQEYDTGPTRGDLAGGSKTSGKPRCASGWIHLHRACYRFVARPPGGWSDAVSDCRKEGAQLLSISSTTEMNNIKRALKNKGSNRPRTTWWIGLRKNNTDWQWLDGGDFSYRITRWKPGEPNNELGKEYCVEMDNKGQINDKDCTALRPFICEKLMTRDGEENERTRTGDEKTDGQRNVTIDDDKSKGQGKRPDGKQKQNRGNNEDNDEEDLLELFAGCFMMEGPSRGNRNRKSFLYTKGSTTCPEVVASGTRWPVTRHNVVQSESCRRGSGNMTFFCGGNQTCWRGEPNVDQCASPAFRNLLKRFSTDDDNDKREAPEPEETLAVTSELANVTKGDDVREEDIVVTSKLIKGLVSSGAATKIKDRDDVKSIVANVVKAGSNLVSTRKTAVLWTRMSEREKIRTATSLLVAMETATVAMAAELKEPTTIVTRDDNIELELRVVKVSPSGQDNEDMVYNAEDSDTQFSIPLQTLGRFSSGGLAKMVFMTHYTMGNILDDNNSDGNRITATDDKAKDKVDDNKTPATLASYIISAAAASSENSVNLPQPVTFTITHTKNIPEGFQPLCSFWSISESGLGVWSQEGCRLVDTNSSHTKCECDHMTNFAVLMTVQDVEISDVHKSLLRMVTIVGCIISCLCLVASWITFTCFTSLQGERNSIHKNLVVCLFIAEMLFLTGIDQTQNRVACGIVAGLMHYFFLAAFLWMMMEGVHIILMLVQVFDGSRSRLPYYYAGAYGPPILIIAISAGLYAEGYGTEEYCWLTTEKSFIWSFAGPVAVILIVNSVILIYAMTMVCRHSDYVFSTKDKTTAGSVRSWIQGAMALEVLLGLTWIIGFFFLTEQSVAMAYIFTILNSTQGLFIFIFHCLLNKKARKEYRRVMRVKRQPSSTGTGSGTHTASLAKNKLTSGPSFNRHSPCKEDNPPTYL